MRLLLNERRGGVASRLRRTDASRRCADNSPAAATESAAASPQAKPGAKPSAKPFAKPGARPRPRCRRRFRPPRPRRPRARSECAAAPERAADARVYPAGKFRFDDGGAPAGGVLLDGPGGGKSPPLNWTGTPSGTRAFALVDQDPDAGGGGSAFTHWVILDLPGNVARLKLA